MKKPKISVLMTAYNAENFLEESIKSVLNQTLKDFEFIIVNDGSTDKTKEIIMKFMKKDDRIIYLENKKNKGFSNWHNILNMGLEKAKGKYIARLDADDLCHRERLKKQYRYLEKHRDIFLLGCSAEVIDSQGKKIGEMIKKPWPPFFLRLFIGFNNPFIHSSLMFRNEEFRYLSKDEHVFYFNLLMNGKNIKNLTEKLVKYRINPEGLVAKEANLEKNKYKDYYKGTKT